MVFCVWQSSPISFCSFERERAGLNHLRLWYIFQKEGGNIFQSKPSFDRIGRKLEKQDLAKGFKFKFFKPNLNIFCTIFALFSSFLFIFLASTSAYFFRTFVFSASIPAIFMGFHISILHIFVGGPKSLLNIQCRFCSPHSQPMHWIKHSMDWKNKNIFLSDPYRGSDLETAFWLFFLLFLFLYHLGLSS